MHIHAVHMHTCVEIELVNCTIEGLSTKSPWQHDCLISIQYTMHVHHDVKLVIVVAGTNYIICTYIL